MTPHPRARSLATLLDRDLGRFEAEVRAYPDDAALWVVAGQIANPAGTLALHLAGNLQHYVGALMGGTGYVRDRTREFAARDLARSELLREIADARRAVLTTLQTMDDATLERPWTGGGPLGEGATTEMMLMHLAGHLNYHLGQINYHRRILAAAS